MYNYNFSFFIRVLNLVSRVQEVHSVFKDMVLRNIFVPTTGKAIDGWGRLLNEELKIICKFYFHGLFWRKSPQWPRASSFRGF